MLEVVILTQGSLSHIANTVSLIEMWGQIKYKNRWETSVATAFTLYWPTAQCKQYVIQYLHYHYH